MRLSAVVPGVFAASAIVLSCAGEPEVSRKSERPAQPDTTTVTASEEPQTTPTVRITWPTGAAPVTENPLTIRGTARTFENSVFLRVSGEKGLLVETSATATGELGEENPWVRKIFLTEDPGRTLTIEAIDHSAKDGSIRSRAVVRVDVRMTPRTLTLYFPNMRRSPDDCSSVFPVDRTLPGSGTPARLAMEALLAGPTGAEAKQGFSSPFPPVSEVQSILLKDGLLTVDLNERLQNVGGACRALAIRSAIENTLAAIPGVRAVRITAGGSDKFALQP